MADYFDRLELELRAAVPRAPARPHRTRRRPGNFVVAISVAVTAAVAVLAVALLGHGPTQAEKPLPPAKPVAPTYPAHAIRKVLAPDGIANTRFSRSRPAVIAALTPLLGPVSKGYTRVQGDCGVDHTMTWPNWPAVTVHGVNYPLDPVLTVFFSHSRFVGYQYGEPGTKVAPRAPAGGTVLATTRGLNIGDTLARGRTLYGGSFTISAAQGGSWRARTPSGGLVGYAWDAPAAHSAVSPRNLIATIDAGDVGCPALTP